MTETLTSQPIRSKENPLVFGSPDIGEEEIREVVESLRSGWLGTGPKVHRFEDDFRTYKQADYAVAVNSCTAALHLSMIAAGVGPGDEVITTAMTFCATVNAIIHAGATPVLADCDPVYGCIDPESIQEKITPQTRAIIPVHFAGMACDMDAIMSLARNHNLKVIEDCAHAIETTYNGQHVGTFGDFGCFSFYVTKNVVTGEGGMILTRNQDDADRVKILALHGMSQDAWKRFSDEGYRHYQVVQPGFKYNMMDLQAALGIHQLARVENNLIRRQTVWDEYLSRMKELPIGLPESSSDNIKHGRHLFTIMIDQDRTGIDRDSFLSAMNRHHIGTGVHYQSIPEHPFYQKAFGWHPDDYPNASAIGRWTASLPLSSKLTSSDINDVVAAVEDVIRNNG